MFVYIAHAAKDQADADALTAFLKSRGLIAHSESGTSGYRHLQPSDVVIGLWSNDAVFDANRMMMERRMLDAWADGRLVLVRLDHGIPPVGLRDLPSIDASFATGRELSVWPQVERAAREAMNRALVTARDEVASSLDGGRSLPGEASREPETPGRPGGVGSGGPSPSQTRPSRPPPPARKGGPIAKGGAAAEATLESRPPGMGWLVLLAGLICMSGAIATLTTDIDPSPASRVVALLVLGAMIVAGLVATAVLAIRAMTRRRRPAPAKAAPAAAAAPEAADAVFVSYAHADARAVEPLVEAVRSSGRKVWIDQGGIQPGEGWAGEIVRGIKSARSVLVMCSPSAFESDHIKREVYLADRYRKPMLPVFLADARPPEDFEYFFAGVQWLELFRLPEAERPAAIGRALSAA